MKFIEKWALFVAIFLFFLAVPLVDGAHYIVGIVNNALDGTSANDHIVLLWNSANGTDDNLTDIVGSNGNSGADNIYMIDCELLNNSCDVGDVLSVRVIDTGDNHNSEIVNVTVTGAGYDIAPNLTLNSPPNVTSVLVDDALSVPANEIDLVAALNRSVTCEAIVDEIDGDSLQNASAEFFHSSSFYGDSDDNNYHYTNDSCYVNSSYGGENESQVFCDFDVRYYANFGGWECFLSVEDNLSVSGNGSDISSINSLLAVGLASSVDFGLVDASEVSDEAEINVTNYGNVMINLSLSGYAATIGDGWAMNCSQWSVENISIDYEKYNLTASTPGSLTLSEFEGNYTNLTDNPVTEIFNLNFRQDDATNDAINETYWRIYAPAGIAGNCSGNIVFGASAS